MSSICVIAGGQQYPIVLSTKEAAEVLGVCEDTARRRCVDGRLPLLPRSGNEPWRVPTGKLFDLLGIEHETTIANRPSEPAAL